MNKKNWLVQTYDWHGTVLNSYTIKNKTEVAALEEAEQKEEIREAFDWSMTEIEIKRELV